MNPALIVIGGGKGTRMASFMPNTPKLLLPLSDDETILSRIVHEIAASRYFFALGKDANKIINTLKTFNIDYQISIEDKPLGTFGALKLIVHKYHNLPYLHLYMMKIVHYFRSLLV